MPVTTAPADEACAALVTQINAGTAYSLDVTAEYADVLNDNLEEIRGLRVDVVPEEEETLEETLATEDRSSHQIRVTIRSMCDQNNQEDIKALRLIVRQIFQRVNDFDSSNGRVKVWQCDIEGKEVPDKEALRNDGLFKTSILLRVEVEAS